MFFLEILLLPYQWKKIAPIPYHEKIARRFDLCYVYINSFQTEIAFIPDFENNNIFIRLSNPAHLHFYYLQILVHNNLFPILDKITELQDQIVSEDHVALLFKMQPVCKVSVFSWEDWEKY